MKYTQYNVDTEVIGDEDIQSAKYLLERKDRILDSLAKCGMHQDEESPYVYYIPTEPCYDCGKGRWTMRALWVIVLLARASYGRAYWLDCDKEGYPELPQFTGGKKGYHRVYITDPLAQQIEAAIERNKDFLVQHGMARIVNGRFFRVA